MRHPAIKQIQDSSVLSPHDIRFHGQDDVRPLTVVVVHLFGGGVADGKVAKLLRGLRVSVLQRHTEFSFEVPSQLMAVERITSASLVLCAIGNLHNLGAA